MHFLITFNNFEDKNREQFFYLDFRTDLEFYEHQKDYNGRMGKDHKLSIGVTLYHVDLCTRLEIYMQVTDANSSLWSIYVLVCLFFHWIIIFITFSF